jgi:hypothetical protein
MSDKQKKPVCGLCGTPCRPRYRAPQPETAPDLDMRPGEPARSTLQDWVQTCRTCTAAAPDLSALPDSARAVVESDAYRRLTTTVAEETLPFQRWAVLCNAAGDRAGMAEALLQAAWAAEDAAAMGDAASLRARVAAAWGDAADTETALRRLDALRRSGAFDEAATWAESVAQRPLDEPATAILAFQRARIASRDIGRHLISSALPPPSHAPHVSHGRQPTPPGFWSRLFRR